MNKLIPLLAFFSILTPGSVLASVPPGGFILKKMSDHRTRTGVVRVVSWVGDGEDGAFTVRLKQVMTMNSKTGALVSRIFSDSDQLLFVMERKLDSSSVPVPLLVLMGAHPDVTGSALVKEAGSSAAHRELKRFMGRPVWILGDRKQLWVEKDEFNPVSWAEPGKQQVDFLEYNRYQDFPYPKLIVLKTGTSTVLHEKLEEIVFLPEEKSREPAVRVGWTEEGAQATPLARDLVSQLYTYVR